MLCDSLERWDVWGAGGRFKTEGTHVRLWLIHVDVWQKPTQVITIQLTHLSIHIYV